jgi:hypothetical protein
MVSTGLAVLQKTIVRVGVEASVNLPNDDPMEEFYALDRSCCSPDPLDPGF